MMYNQPTYYGYQPTYYGVNGSMPDNLTQLRMSQGQMQTPVVPQPAPTQTQAQTSSGLIWVQGEAGAKSYLVAPNTTVMLMDSEGDRFYLKSADASGMPLPLRTFDYVERSNAPTSDFKGGTSDSADFSEKYVTREEFERRLASMSHTCKCKESAKKSNLTEGVEDGELLV